MALAFKRAVTTAESSSYFKTDTEEVFTKAGLKKPYKIAVDWDLIKSAEGTSCKGDAANILLCHLIGGDRLTYPIKAAIEKILADDMGKEAFQDAFDGVAIKVRLAAAPGCTVAKEGKVLTFNVAAHLDEQYGHFSNTPRAIDSGVLAKAIENML